MKKKRSRDNPNEILPSNLYGLVFTRDKLGLSIVYNKS